MPTLTEEIDLLRPDDDQVLASNLVLQLRRVEGQNLPERDMVRSDVGASVRSATFSSSRSRSSVTGDLRHVVQATDSEQDLPA